MDVVLAGKKQPLADWELAEAFLFFAGQLKDIGQDIHSAGALLEQYLQAGVGDNRPAHARSHKVLHVLGYGG